MGIQAHIRKWRHSHLWTNEQIQQAVRIGYQLGRAAEQQRIRREILLSAASPLLFGFQGSENRGMDRH